jgi:hypothetical protein
LKGINYFSTWMFCWSLISRNTMCFVIMRLPKIFLSYEVWSHIIFVVILPFLYDKYHVTPC